ncbi:hypothetical protein LTR28_009319, partial [Elasticomyces elasticus]
MYIEPKAISIYAYNGPRTSPSTEMSAASQPRPPPRLHERASSSSLGGLERAIPSFRTFVKTTPPPNQQKPLPPVPLANIRSSTVPGPSTRRASSVYSRTVSQWVDGGAYEMRKSWQSADFSTSDFFLQPTIYSNSTPQLAERPPSPPLLEPLRYNPHTPSIETSSSTCTTRASTPAPPTDSRPSVLLPPRPAVSPVSLHCVQMVSLDKAQAAAQARSAVPLLPEELRAMARARPQFQSSAHSYRTDRAPTPPPLLLLPTQSSTESLNRDAKSSLMALDAPVSELSAPVALQPRNFSQNKAMEALGINTPGLRSPRSFSKHKIPPVGPRTLDYAHYLPGRQTPDSAVSEKSEAQQLSEEYHASLTNQYREENMFGLRKDSFESTSAEMKMIPQPLFFHRKASSISFAGHGRAGNVGPSPTASHKASIASSRDNRRSSLRDHIRMPSMPFKLSLTPSSTGSDRRRSTSGSIPISPPYNLRLAAPFPVLNEASSTARRPSASGAYARRNSDPNRFSAFYPRTNPKSADA